jgi:hypothetical protein
MFRRDPISPAMRLIPAQRNHRIGVETRRTALFSAKGRVEPIALLVSVLMVAAHAVGSEPPPIPSTPASVLDLVLARPFTLAKGYKYDWRADRPIVTSGTLVVLKVDPAFVFPRNSAEPVLYVGNQTAQRLNQGYQSGHVIAIIPGNVDFARDPIWFGRPDLPERVTEQTIRTQRALAEAAKIKPFPASKVQGAIQKRLQASDLHELLRDQVADLVLKYSPQEKDLAETWRLPVARGRPKQK